MLLKRLAQVGDNLLTLLNRQGIKYPAIAQTSKPFYRDIACAATKPDRNVWLNRQRVNSSIFDSVILAVKGNQRLAQEFAQQYNLFLAALAAIMEIFIQ